MRINKYGDKAPKFKPYKYKKLKSFNLGLTWEKKGHIYINRSYNNIFITLTDLNNKVINCKSTGCLDLKNKRKKRISFTIEDLIKRFRFIFRKYRIQSVTVITFICLKGKGFMVKFLNKLKEMNIKVNKLQSRRIIAHNGVRGIRLRRV